MAASCILAVKKTNLQENLCSVPKQSVFPGKTKTKCYVGKVLANRKFIKKKLKVGAQQRLVIDFSNFSQNLYRMCFDSVYSDTIFTPSVSWKIAMTIK